MATPRFLRKTTLAGNEYRKNFRQIDNDVIEVITSPEADAVTPLMSKIYLKLLKAPDHHVESAGVLRFEEEIREGKRRTAWQVLCHLLGVSSSTANKAIKWLHQQGVIGYFAAKNGVGLRIFLNRASASIGMKPQVTNKKILPFAPASAGESRASSNGAGFNGSFHDQENLDTDITSRAPDGGADQPPHSHAGTQQPRLSDGLAHTSLASNVGQLAGQGISRQELVGDILALLKAELEPSLQAAAARAASREHEKMRQWLEAAGLPKVARVAQREAYNVLRKHGLPADSKGRARSQLMVGAHTQPRYEPRLLSEEELRETAEICVTLFQARGQAIDVTLSELGAEAGAYLLAEDAPKVRRLAEGLIRGAAIKE
jgi:hypothetical protein